MQRWLPAYVVLQILATKRESVRFETRASGALTVTREGDRLAHGLPCSGSMDVCGSTGGLERRAGNSSG